jgi:hypothetical protein
VGKITVDRVAFVLLVLTLLIVSSVSVYSQVYQSKCPLVAYEGEMVALHPEGYDPDKDIGPAGHLIWEFSTPFDAQGRWQTFKGQRGIYDFWVSVSDGELKDTKRSCVELLPNNKPPILYPVEDIYLTRGESTKITASCIDPDGDPVSFSYRFNGKDVVYIVYEPPGVYDLEVICSDGFGGIAQQNAKLHVLMPEEPKPAPKPKPIIYVAPVSKPSTVEVVLPKAAKPEVVDVTYPSECVCPENEDVEVVIYDGFYPVESLTNNTRTFVISEPKIEPVQNKTRVCCCTDI